MDSFARFPNKGAYIEGPVCGFSTVSLGGRGLLSMAVLGFVFRWFSEQSFAQTMETSAICLHVSCSFELFVQCFVR